MKGILRWVVCVLIASGFQGCAGPYSLVEFEVLEPATVIFPRQVERLIILNRAPFTLDVIGENNRKGMERNHLFIVDTLITNSLFRGVRETLKQSPAPGFQHPVWLTDRRPSDTTGLEDLALTRREVIDLCSDYGADAVISLEYYSLKLEDEYIYYSDANEVQNHFYEVSNETKWNIYLPDRPRSFDQYRLVDTLFFTTMLDGQLQIAPTIPEMVAELFFISGVKYGQYLVPVWTPTVRPVLTGREDSLRTASKLTASGEWEGAFDIWMDLTRSADKTVAAKAYHNLAVYYELEDQLDSSSLFIDYALELDTLEWIQQYRQDMDTRIQNRKTIESQIIR